MKKLNLKKVYSLESPPFKECPYCGGDIFYKKESCYGKYEFYFSYNKDDDVVDNSSMYNTLSHKDIGKFIYCDNCNKKLFKYRE